jgi:hypothetical protein
MDNTVLKTSADDLYELVKSKNKISLEDAAKILNLPVNVVQGLVDFLVEDKIFGIEYKFTTPYIYLSNEKDEIAGSQGKYVKKLLSKDDFYKKANRWNIPSQKMADLWKKYVEENLSVIKKEFYIKANSREIPKEKIDILWKKYLTYLV